MKSDKIDFTELSVENNIKPGDKLSSNADAFLEMIDQGNRRREYVSAVFPKLNPTNDAAKDLNSNFERLQKTESSQFPDLGKMAAKVLDWFKENIIPSKNESVAALFGGMRTNDLSFKENGSGSVSGIELSGWGGSAFGKNLEFVESLGEEGSPVKHGFDYDDYAKIGLAKSGVNVMPDSALVANDNLAIEHGFNSYLQPRN